MQPLSTLVRRATIAGTDAGDARFVVTADGRGAVLAKGPQGISAVVSAIGILGWRAEPGGVIVIDAPGGEWRGQRDTRCGSCGGRFQLSNADPEPFLPSVEERPDDAHPGELAAPAYGDTY